MTYSHPLCSMSIGPPILRSMVKAMCVVKGQGHFWPWKFKGHGHGQGQTHWSHLRSGDQSIYLLFILWQFGSDIANSIFDLENSKSWPRSNLMVTFEAKSSIHIFAFSFVAIGPFLTWDIANSLCHLENSRSRSWPWSNLMIIFEALISVDLFAFCFVAIGYWTIFDWDRSNSIFDLENSRSRSWLRSNLMVTFEA